METTPTAAFGQMVEAVMGQALAAAGYVRAEVPVQQAGGLYRYDRETGDTRLSVEFQVLVYGDASSRFVVTLCRAAIGADALLPVRITLPALLWDVFGVQVLPSAHHWWPFATQQALGDALLEAGKLLFAYGLPWLDGSLLPDSQQD